MVQRVWQELPEHYAGVGIDIFPIMPNHVHGIIILTDARTVGAGPCACPATVDTVRPQGIAPTRISLPDVVHRFKSLTSALYRKGITENRWAPLHNKLWQRNYYEHIIRNQNELDRILQYIEENPLKWDLDRENPTALVTKKEETWQV